MRSTLWFGEGVITSIDHAYIDKDGDIIGGSVAPAFEVTGEVEKNEQVVIDFSNCKKRIKEIIDDRETGIDHKLVVGDWSKIISTTTKNGQVTIETPKWTIEGPTNMFHFCPNVAYGGFAEYIGEFVTKCFDGIRIETYSGLKPALMPWQNFCSFFRYTHGLKSSSSWGCQNIAHGHYSFISIQGHDKIAVQLLQEHIAQDLDKVMFIYQENITGSNMESISYTTERGFFRLTSKVDDNSKFVSLPTETTIENLVEYIVKRYARQLAEASAYSVYVSEGLQKGACVEL